MKSNLTILSFRLPLQKVGQDLANALGMKLYDMEWDVRDNVVEFIGNLFVAVSQHVRLTRGS